MTPFVQRIRKIRRGLDELAADMEVIKLEKFQRDLFKAPKDAPKST